MTSRFDQSSQVESCWSLNFSFSIHHCCSTFRHQLNWVYDKNGVGIGRRRHRDEEWCRNRRSLMKNIHFYIDCCCLQHALVPVHFAEDGRCQTMTRDWCQTTRRSNLGDTFPDTREKQKRDQTTTNAQRIKQSA